MAEDRVTVDVDGRRLSLSNLDKVLYPDAGFTKGQVIDYYARIAPVILPHLRDRALTFRRWPGGVRSNPFYEKNAGRNAPSWVKTAKIAGGGRGQSDDVNLYPLVNDVPTLIWAANLAALELHVPQWKVGPRGARRNPDLLVFDLDPGEPASIVECCRVAERLRDLLEADGLRPYAKTSGSKGMQLYAAVKTTTPEDTSSYAKAAAKKLAGETPAEVTAVMKKDLRPGKVFIDWSQNNPHKTTVAPYSLRGRDEPTVSTPLTWDEVAACTKPAQLKFLSDDVLDRVDEFGDLLGDLHEDPVKLPRAR
ncbi:non-homologous end-joining DNA ligase [Amycolatopsis endophytica]|uniref:Bifunctional non-homologous end joining protein LigD n=1 Tax=Amycolatopsis endophytica TaxID=860233 RepID=A0A853AWU1_9PSEU|nr:non-homologous end-joining DNA ligase [Amycolatopsis endophytica]NYI87203.1 bifunctional non-homologous end joining protein LigD [Amycolatopsis endophytica]